MLIVGCLGIVRRYNTKHSTRDPRGTCSASHLEL